MEAVHDKSCNEPAVQDIPEDEKILLERSHHTIEDLMGAQFHHHFGHDDNQSDEAKADVRAPPAEYLVGLKPKEFHISEVPSVIFRKKSSSVRWG
jgi:hypothetical protein